MKNLAELKQQFPEVYAQHEAAVKSERDKHQALADAIGSFNRQLVEQHGVTQLQHETTDKEVLDRIDKANAEKRKVEADLAAAQAEAKKQADAAEAAKVEAEKLKAEKASAERINLVGKKVAELLKGNKHAEIIGKHVEARLPDTAFDVAAAEKFVKEKAAEYQSIAEAVAKEVSKVGELYGEDDEKETDTETTSDDKTDKKSLAESIKEFVGSN